MTPRISVLLAVYNGERHLEQSLRSILAQTLTDFEVIVVDDGSTDRTAAILASFDDPRLRVVRQENRGLTVSLIRGVSLARGVYIARQDADDVSPPERFRKQAEYLDAHPAVAALGSWADVVDGSGNVVGALRPPSGPQAVKAALLHMRVAIVHGSTMMRRDALDAVGGYRAGFPVCQDYDLWLRLASRFDLDNLPETLNQWRVDRGSVYATRRAVQLKHAGIAVAFAHERMRYGADSYEQFRGESLESFVSRYRLGPFVHAIWAELLLRGVGNSGAVRHHARRALRGGYIRPKSLGIFAWTHLRLPSPARPVGLPDATE